MSTSENTGIYCRNCGRQCLEGDSFCPSCGLPLDPVKSERTHKVVHERKPRSPVASRFLSVKFFRNAAILLLSILVLVTAFVPLVQVDTGTEINELIGVPLKVEFRFSGIDFITFFIDSLHNDTAKEIEESRLCDRLLDAEAEAERTLDDVTNANDLTRDQKQLIERMVHLSLRVMLRSEDAAFAPSLLFSAVTSLLYMMFAVAFFVFALLNLLFHLLGRRDLFTVSLRFLCLVPGATLVLHYAARVWLGNTFFHIAPRGTIVWSVAGALVLVVAVMIIGLATRTVRFRAGALVRTLCVSVCAFVMLSVLLLAPLSVKLTGKFPSLMDDILPGETGADASASTVKARLDWSFFDSISMTEDGLKDFDAKTFAALSALSAFKRSDYSRGTMGATAVLHTATAYVLRMATGDGSGMDVFAFLPVIALLAALAAAWMLGEGLLYLATGRCKRQTYMTAKLSACILSFLLLIVLLVTVIIFNITVEQSNIKALAENEVFGSVVGENGRLHRMIHMQIGAAPIVVAVFSLLALLLPLPVAKRSEAVTLPMPEEEAAPVAE